MTIIVLFSFGCWQTFFADPFVQEHVRLDAVVCLCDSPRLLRTLVASTTSNAGAEGSAPAEEGSGQTSDSSGTGPAAAAAATLVMSQLALSDRVLLNKSDLITPAEVSSTYVAQCSHRRCSQAGWRPSLTTV